MTLETERIFKYSNEDRGTRHPLGAHVLKPRERSQKKKHLVAAELPNTPLSSDCNSSRDAQPTNHWISKSMALTIILVSTWFFQRNGRAPSPGSSSILNVGDTQSGMLMRLAAQIADLSATLPCSGHGYLEIASTEGSAATCKCYECFGGVDCSQVINTCVIDLDHGDPTMFEDFWFRNGGNSITVILGYQRMSYFAQSKHVWFMESELDQQIRALHQVVGNAVTEGRHIVVGTGSTQLFQAVLYALSSPDQPKPTNIVSAAPFYSSYPSVTDYLRSALFKWAGDAAKFDPAAESAPYIEMVTSPNNPDGKIQHAIVNGTGHVVHDLAYYWPHFTPITEAADHDVMLFTLSKSTGHAGTRIGWAILKDEKVAKKMIKFLELQTIGVSHDSQVRATQILKAVVQGYASTASHELADHRSYNRQSSLQQLDTNKLFHFGSSVMQYRWKRLRSALNTSSELSILDFEPSYCTFFEKEVDHAPAFAWIRCKKVLDCQDLLKKNRIITRSGRHFGVGREYVRLSMLERNQKFEMMVDRLARIDSSRTPD
ncbi:hypothetical protein KC19_8G172900 [Ceratodon purpureus]|uniref:Uncharacterized protein n=1 Tax=Ceratodon purpureus TaxID=3225 RepID=A0A8T0H214_CERPU|nr:hypothetical protein KC19_8G172900 [Ceratodon purpureus]